MYTWESDPADTVVTWTLEPIATGGARLSLAQTGFRPQDDWIYELLMMGWRDRSGDLLKQLVPTL